MDRKWLADLLRQMREDAGLTQAALAAKLPPSPPTKSRGSVPRTQGYVQKLESGESGASVEEVAAWAAECDRDAELVFHVAGTAEQTDALVRAAAELPAADLVRLARIAAAMKITPEDAREYVTDTIEDLARLHARAREGTTD